jgi:hypothetical protein
MGWSFFSVSAIVAKAVQTLPICLEPYTPLNFAALF